MSEVNLKIKLMDECDLDLLNEWLLFPHIKRWWRAEWTREINLSLGDEDSISKKNISNIISVAGQKIGLIQTFEFLGEEVGNLNNSEWGIRFFIGEKKFLNQNFGSKAISNILVKLFEDESVHRIIAEPQADNWPAIIALQRAGFRNRGRITRPGFNLVQLTAARSFFEHKK